MTEQKIIERLTEELEIALSINKDLNAALRNITERYCDLVNSGDAGHWNPEKEKEVIAARKAMETIE